MHIFELQSLVVLDNRYQTSLPFGRGSRVEGN